MTFLKSAVVAAAVWVACIAGPSGAAIISVGSPTTSVPSALSDPLSSFSLFPLQPNQFLLPIQIAGATGLQDWSFDLTFNDDVVTPLDIGGLFQSVSGRFNATDTTLSNITSSGFFLPDVLQGIAGFSSAVSGDGLLAFVLFQFQTGQETNDPNFGIDNPTVTQQVPEPGTLALLVAVAGGMGLRRLLARRGMLPLLS